MQERWHSTIAADNEGNVGILVAFRETNLMANFGKIKDST